MPTSRIDLDLIIIRLRLTNLLPQRRLRLQHLALAHHDILVADRHAVRHLELRNRVDNHIRRLETRRVATELRVDQPLAPAPAIRDGGLGTQLRAAPAAPAETRDAHFGAGRQVGAHVAREREHVRVRTGGPGAIHEGDHGGEDAEDGANAAQLAPEVGPGDGAGHVVHRVHEGDGRGPAGDDVRHDDFEARLGRVLVGEELVVDQGEAEGVGDEENRGGGGGGCWGGGNVARFAVERFFVAGWGAVLVGGAFEAVGTRHGGREWGGSL